MINVAKTDTMAMRWRLSLWFAHIRSAGFSRLVVLSIKLQIPKRCKVYTTARISELKMDLICRCKTSGTQQTRKLQSPYKFYIPSNITYPVQNWMKHATQNSQETEFNINDTKVKPWVLIHSITKPNSPL
jgi:hypothetical protein